MIELQVDIVSEVIYSRSKLDLEVTPMMFAPPTHEEIVRGFAIRQLHLTPELVWEQSGCMDCGLPLRFHPPGRRKRTRRRYCDSARRWRPVDE